MQKYLLWYKNSIHFNKQKQLLANLVMIVVVVLWGISFISIKIAVSEIPPTTMALLRFIIASVFLRILLKKVEPNAKISRNDLPKMAAGGVLGITCYFYFENMGVQLSTAANASLIVSIVPIIAIGLDVLFFKSKITPLKLAAVGIAVLGTYLSITANGKIEFNSNHFLGNILMICAMISWALYTLINKSLQGRYSGICMTTYQTIIGTLCLVPVSILEYSDWRVFSLLAFWHVLFLAIGCSVICYVFYMYVLKHLDVAITTIYLSAVPVIGVVSGHYFLKESVFPIQMMGGMLTILAIIAVNIDSVKAKENSSCENCNDY
ncbi:DMT family transporter [Pelosinus propionicus]|uniref:Permease of the drug/metabolite transporter (DMT) superfamily n=1 Tax=Pelosinus propionicus DSM 13327 TaxID=1123291 RepID=A0A1I4MY65_9FIRM|nr:DMT family transporter [Pelosinus propionicus]SFM08027.1 Permease of the drug/metabolite transporter (DMT) superfamily [Pelosinus propionicus DSM 13327]